MLNSPYKKPYITPPAEHPRVMFRQSDKQRIVGNFTHPENRRAYELWQRICKKDFREFYDDIIAGKYNLMVCFMIESKAFEAWVEDDEKKARDIIDNTKKIVERYSIDRNVNLMLCRHTGHVVFVVSLVYDWLYKYFTEEEKIFFIAKCEQFLEASMEVGYPPTKQRNTHSHSHEAQYLRDMLSFSIATYDERPDIYDFVVGRIINDLVPFYKFSFSTQLNNQGPSYGSYRQVSALWAQLLFYQMSGQRIFDECVENADGYYYLTRADGQSLRIGNDCNDDKGGGHVVKHPFTIVNFFAASLTGNANYKKYFIENYRDEVMVPTHYGIDLYKDTTYGEGLYSPVTHLVFNLITPQFNPKPYEKARYFKYPAGTTIYKDEEKNTTVYMKIGELWCQGHEHYDTGDFQIYHNGILVSSSGAYYWYGCEHFYNYDTVTSSHNCLTIRDENVKNLGYVTTWCKKQLNLNNTKVKHDDVEKEMGVWGDKLYLINDGGTRRPVPTTNYDLEPDLAAAWQRDCQMAKVLSHTETEDKVEIVGDLTTAYSHTCESVVRKMTFEPKLSENGVFTVEDEVTAKSEEFIKCFHIHMMEEPKIEENIITITHKGGKLRCTVLEPQNASITAIGGGDMRFTTVGIPVPSDKTENRECGWGKVIISPKTQAKTHKFKVQMEILDNEI
ncbi:MAG: heparinase II/III family protein [Clostridia bacterium]|nr:heparinase II/III family protein [Clostridia bacterium]